MKKSKFTDAQMAFVLRHAKECAAIGEVCRKAVISEAVFKNWRKQDGGLMPSEMRRLKHPEGISPTVEVTPAKSAIA